MSHYTRTSSFVAIALLFSVWACKHEPISPSGSDPNDPPTNSVTCDPDSVYFQNQVLPLLVSNCTQSGCHNTQDHKEGVILDSYSSLINTVEKVTSTNWSKNKLMEVITDSDPDDRMPPAPAAPLTTEQINLIGKWISQGTFNNQCDESGGNCDLAANRYSQFVKPLIMSKCQGCHSGSNPQGGINLATYAGVRTVALNGQLYSSLTAGSGWMPKGGAKLDNCSLDKIKAWIDSGAPEN